MRNILLTLFCLCNTLVFSQNIKFPESFKYDPKIIPEMKIAEINDELQKLGITKNPGVLITKEEMKVVVKKYDITNVNKVYIEIYQDSKNERDDAGVVVTEFNSVKHLEEILPNLYSQSNYVLLTIENYLILVWNDGQKSDERLRESVNYYIKNTGAKEFIPEINPEADETFSETTETTETTETIETTEPKDELAIETMVSPEGMYTELGFGIVLTELFSSEEIKNLLHFVSKFEKNYHTQIAITNIGNQELKDEMIADYASHLVFNNKERIKNNIVIIFDEITNHSWVYFGTENGKTLKKLPMENLKKEFNELLQKGEIFLGLNQLLLKLEIAVRKP